MAVFPDRIVLKNSTDSQAAIEAAIQTGGADEITQGEIVLGINPASVQFYTKAGDGSIVTLGGTSVSTLGGLTDVDLSTPATDGQLIAYNATSGNWEPVDQSGSSYTDPLTTDGDIVIRNGGVTTRLGIGVSGQVLTVTGGIPSWENAAGGATSINDLTDVDTSTTPPTTGQVLTWVAANSKWEAADAVSGGAVTSLDDVEDVQYPQVPGAWTGQWEIDTLAPGQLKSAGYISPSNDNGGGGNISYNDQATGTDYSAELNALSGGTVYFKVGSNAWSSGSVGTVTLNTSSGSSLYTVLLGCIPLRTALLAATVGDLVYLSNQPNGNSTSNPSDGQVLTWVDANSQWEPTELGGTAVRAALGIGEYADDAAAGTGGVASGAMYYNTTSADYRLKA